VVARQRPETAKGVVFLLLEDEAGMMNVIVRPEVYDRDRIAVRGEPFLRVTGRLAKDDGALNVLADEVRGLKLRGTGDGGRGRGASNPSLVPPPPSPYSFLKSMRSVAPDSKDWG